MSLCFHPVECHAIHASCTIKGLVTNYTVIFANYAKFNGGFKLVEANLHQSRDKSSKD